MIVVVDVAADVVVGVVADVVAAAVWTYHIVGSREDRGREVHVDVVRWTR